MGWIPSSTPVGVEAVLITSGAAARSVYWQDPQGVYDPVSDRTYIAYLGLQRDLYVTFYDHQTRTVATPVEVGTYPLADDDDHGSPSVAIGATGHIHVIWGAHSTALRHSKSDNPWDISAWTTQNLATGTYSVLTCDPDSGHLYVVDRAGSTHGTGFPKHEYGQIQISTDDGETWSSAAQIVDTTATPENASDFLPMGLKVVDGLLHILWSVARDTAHSATRVNVYHAIYDPDSSTLSAIDGTEFGSSIDWGEHSDCVVISGSVVLGTNMAVDGDRLAVITGFDDSDAFDFDHYISVWDGSAWVSTDMEIPGWDPVFWQTVYFINGALRAIVSVDNGGTFADIELWAGLEDGSDWYKISTLLAGDSGEGWTRVSPVAGGGPSVALALPDPTGSVETSATASDLLPLHLILDPAAEHITQVGGAFSPVDHEHPEYAPLDHSHADVAWLPLTTTDENGDPVLVWDDNDSLIPTEVPL